MGRAQQKRRAVLIVEDDPDISSLTAALFEDKELDTIECARRLHLLSCCSAGVRSP